MLGIWINKFKIFASRASSAPDKALIIVMAALAFRNLLRFPKEIATP